MVLVLTLMSVDSPTFSLPSQGLDSLGVGCSHHHRYQVLGILVDKDSDVDLMLGFERAPADAATVFDVLRHCTSHGFCHDVG